MNNYYDKYSRLHHKPCVNGEPSSNNGWIYTAYAAKVGVPVDRDKLFECILASSKDEPIPHFTRSPGKDGPPMSRDEVLGLTELRVVDYGPNEKYGWNFSPYPLPKFSPLKLIKQLSQLLTFSPASADGSWVKLVGPVYTRHRNYFWQNNLDQLYRFAFSVPRQDRYSILKKWGSFRFYKPSHLLYAAIASVDKLGKASGIRFLKYGGEKNKAAMVKDFPEDHPITLAVKGE